MTGTGNIELTKGVGRAFAGSLLFALPLLMTMEFWRLAQSVERYRLALLVLATVGLYLWFTAPEDPILPDTYTVM